MQYVSWSLQEIWSREQEEFLSEREEAEMDMSDSEDGESAPVAKKKKKSNEITSGKATSLFVLLVYLQLPFTCVYMSCYIMSITMTFKCCFMHPANC